MPIKDFYKLKESLSNFKFINASNIIWKLRIIKSKNEISKLKKIISIASKAFDGLPNQIKINNTEIEICN